MLNKEASGFLDALLWSITNAKTNIIVIEEILGSSEEDEDYAAINNAFKNIKIQAELIKYNTEFLIENTEDYDEPFCGEGGL